MVGADPLGLCLRPGSIAAEKRPRIEDRIETVADGQGGPLGRLLRAIVVRCAFESCRFRVVHQVSGFLRPAGELP